MKKFVLLFLLMVVVIYGVFAQWSDDPEVNTIVNNMSGEQIVPHIAYDADGNFYIGFYSYESGNYNIRLHYFDYDGNAQWGTDGILVSDNTQNSWVTEWDLTTDTLGNCVLTFNDVRDGNANVYAYAISPSGTLLWGNDGIQLTSDTQDEYVPSITVNADNNTIVAWSRPTTTQSEIVMQKIEPDGTLSWGTSGITYQAGTENYTGARVLGVDGDNYILVFYKETGSFPGLTRHIYAQEFDGSGSTVWSSDVLVSDANGISAFTNFTIKSDNANGVVIAWMDDNDFDNNIDCEVQHVLNDGSINWPANGVEVSSYNNYSHQNVRILGVDNSNNVMVVWDKKNTSQSQTAIAGQKFSSDGTRQWTDGGIEFVPMSGDIFGNAGGAVFNGTSAIIVYDEFFMGAVNSHIKAFGVDGSGDFLWTPNITLMASRSTEKSSIDVTDIYDDEQLVAVWEEGSSSDIYMQNILTDGTLGEAPPHDNATLMDLTVNDETVEGFDPDIYNYDVGIPDGDPLPVVGATPADPNATVDITQASDVPGTATVVVTAEDGVTELTYTVDFHVSSTDATLSDLTVNGETIEGFDPGVFYYEYTVPTGDPIPVVGATPNDANATVVITQAEQLPDTAYVVVTAEDGTTANTYSVNFLYTPSSDATLFDLTVDNETIEGFDPEVFNYDYGAIIDDPIPNVDGETNDLNASLDVTQCEEIPGDATLVVTAEDGETTNTYTVSFYYLNNDATLSDLTVNGMTIDGFDPETFYYEYYVPVGDTIPIVDGTTTDTLATLMISQAEEIPGDATLEVIAEDGVSENTYTVHFYTSSDDASLSDLTVDSVTVEGFDPSVYEYEVDVYEGDEIPVIDGTPTDSLATLAISQASTLPGDGTIEVTAEDSITQQTYTVHFNLITSVVNQKEGNISVYPNPANDRLFVENVKGEVDLEISDLTGKTLYSGKLNERHQVDVSFLGKGTYLLIVRNADGLLKTIKFVKR